MSNEVIVAIVGVVGVIVTAVLSNWDKMFPDKNKITAKVKGYTPTGNYETELRTFFNVSGTRAVIENMTFQLLQQMMLQTIQQYPEDAEEITMIFRTIAEESVTLDDVIRKLLPIYQKYYSIENLQELNRFYSTEIMQQMVKHCQAMAVESAPLQLELINENQEKIFFLIERKLGEINKQLPSSTADA